MRESDVWLFRIGAAILTFAAVFLGCLKGGRYLHEQEATARAHRERADAELHEDAVWLANGYRDTQGYRDLSGYLTKDDGMGSIKAHFLEEHAAKIAGGAAIAAALLLGESARIWARKRDAKRRLGGR